MVEIKPITGELVKVPLADLHCQYIPVLTPDDIWNHDTSLVNSPHVELARLLLEHGCDWDVIQHSRFVADRRHRFRVGETKWTESYIREHIFESRYRTLKSLEERGFLADMCEHQPVSVLERPLWATRFGMDIEGKEIQRGHRRCSAALALGWTHIPAILCEDARQPGDRGKYEKKLQGIVGVWEASGLPGVVTREETEDCLRALLAADGYALEAVAESTKARGRIRACRGDEVLHLEVLGSTSKGPVRPKDFAEAFFGAVAQLDHGAGRCAIALPDVAGCTLPLSPAAIGAGWSRIGRAFPELEVWLVDVGTRAVDRRAWNDWLGAGV